MEPLIEQPSKGRIMFVPTTISQERKYMQVKNTPAYYCTDLVEAVESFREQVQGMQRKSDL